MPNDETISRLPGPVEEQVNRIARDPKLSKASTKLNLLRQLLLPSTLEKFRNGVPQPQILADAYIALGRPQSHTRTKASDHPVKIMRRELSDALRGYYERHPDEPMIIIVPKTGSCQPIIKVNGQPGPRNVEGDRIHAIGVSLAASGDFAKAKECFQQAARIAQAVENPTVSDRHHLAESLYCLAGCFFNERFYAEAEALYRQAIEITQNADPATVGDSDDLGTRFDSLAYCVATMERHSDAEYLFRKAAYLKLNGDRFGIVHHDGVAYSLGNAASAKYRLGKVAEALEMYKYAFAEAEITAQNSFFSRAGVRDDLIGGYAFSIATCLWEVNAHQEAIEWLYRAGKAHENAYMYGLVGAPVYGWTLFSLATCLHKLQRYRDARSWFESAAEAIQKSTPPLDFEVLGAAWQGVGACFAAEGLYKEAVTYLEKAIEAKQKGDSIGYVYHDSLAETLRGYAQVLAALGRTTEAEAAHGKAIQELERLGNLRE